MAPSHPTNLPVDSSLSFHGHAHDFWDVDTRTFSPEFDNGLALAVAGLFFVWALPRLARARAQRRFGAASAVSASKTELSVNDDKAESQPLLTPTRLARNGRLISGNFSEDGAAAHDAASLADEFNSDVVRRQTATFWVGTAVHVAIIVLSSLDAYRERNSWNYAWWYIATWSVVQPLFWAVGLAVRWADRATGLPASASLQVFYFLIFIATTVRFYDVTVNQVVPDEQTLPRGTVTTCVFALVATNFAVCLAEITVMRMSPLYERHSEEELLRTFEGWVIRWVDSGAYTPPEGHPKMKFADMTSVERHEASKQFCKKKVNAGLCVSMLFRMVMSVDGILMLVGIMGAITGAVGSIVFALANGRMTDVAGRAEYCRLFQASAPQSTPPQCHDIKSQILRAGMYYILPLLLIGFGQFLNGSFVEVSGTRLICRAQRMVFTAIMRQDSSYFDEQKVGEITSLLSTNVGMMRAGLTSALANCVKGLFQTVLGMFFMLRGVGGSKGSSSLFGSVVGCGMPAILAIFVLMKSGTYFAKAQAEKSQKANGVATEFLTSIKTLLSFNLEEYAVNKYSIAVRKTQSLGITNDILKGAMLGIVYASWMSAMGLGWFFGATPVYHGDISFSYLATFIGLISQVLQGIMGIFGVLPALAAAIGAATALLQPMLLCPSVKDIHRKGKRLPSARGDVALENVRFAYPTKPDLAVFEEFNLKIPRGRSIAIVGTSGSGKSTILQLASRFYDPLGGRVTLDGVDLRELDPEWLHDRIGMVMQEPRLLSGTIEENIRLGKKDATRAEIEHAARLANAHDFIMAQPEGYQTQIGEGGATLSGGQKQRIAIARAVVKDPAILLLDEATSALDSTAEEEVQKALELVSRGRTTLTVAHRQSAIENADVIYVLENGLIVETGTFAELRKAGGNAPVFNRLYNATASGAQLGEPASPERVATR